MSNNEIELTRRELYKYVWSVPITRLSERYGLSDVGLAKICKKYNIPHPPRGYWAKIEAGQKLQKTPLPVGKSNQVIVLSSNPPSKFKEKATAEVLAENHFHIPIIVPETLRGSHPLIKQSAEILKSIDPDDLGMLVPPKEECLDMNVSKKSMRRALLIMDGLIKALEEDGCDVFFADDSTQVKILDLPLKFRISEELMTVRKEPKKHDLDGYYRFGHSRFNTERVLSGNLCLTIEESFWRWSDHHRKNWRDTKKKRLEDHLNGFVKGLLKAAAQKKAYLQEEEEKQRKRREMEIQRQERQRIQAEKLQRMEQEQERVSKLVTDAENWRQSRLLREYIAEVERQAKEGKTNYLPEGDLSQWLEWAHQQADRLDPLSPSPVSILDEEIEEEEKPRRYP